MPELARCLQVEDDSEAYMCLSKMFVSSDAKERQRIIDGWDFFRNWDLPQQSKLACSVGERWTCKERIIASLVYDIFAYEGQSDIREALIGWAVIYHSCVFAGISPVAIFSDIADMAPLELGEQLRSFILRTDEDKSLEAFCLKVKVNENGEREIMPDWMI